MFDKTNRAFAFVIRNYIRFGGVRFDCILIDFYDNF